MAQQRKASSGRGAVVRIIGGQWKRTPLPVLEAEGLRPTPDRVRETVFNWLDHLLERHWSGLQCVDLFAGTGALGFESASRGAAGVQLLDSHPGVVRHLNTIRDKLDAGQVRILREDALSWLQKQVQAGARFDVVFADPPYHHGWLARLLPLCEQVLAPGGLVYAESEYALEAEVQWMQGWDILRSGKAGMVFYHVLQRAALQNGA